LSTNYPYTGVDGNCNYDASLGVVKANGFSFVPFNNPFQL
jgi:hypothetical protein